MADSFCFDGFSFWSSCSFSVSKVRKNDFLAFLPLLKNDFLASILGEKLSKCATYII